MILTNEIFKQNENGEWIVEQTNIVTIDIDQQIADKEAQLLDLYAELQTLKEKQTN